MKKPISALNVLLYICVGLFISVLVIHYWDALKDSVKVLGIFYGLYLLQKVSDPPNKGNENGDGLIANNSKEIVI